MIQFEIKGQIVGGPDDGRRTVTKGEIEDIKSLEKAVKMNWNGHIYKLENLDLEKMTATLVY